jgi:16S rRNA (guanine527-N7)-methyltransferase
MGADSFSIALAAARHVGVELDEAQVALLGRFHTWLGSESMRAGGVGPDEETRLWDRHIADSLVFSLALTAADTCIDLGSGTGLPGIPLAVAHPHIEFTLLDRSGRRCDLMRRSVAILDLPNCIVRQQDIADVADRFDAVVSRAAIPPKLLMIHVKRILKPRGIALVGLSRTGNTGILPVDDGEMSLSMVSIPAEILDSGASLLRIEAT